jgi:hypothetical protein
MGDDLDPKALLKMKQALDVIDKAESSLQAAMKAKKLAKVKEACKAMVAAHKKFDAAQKEL